METSVENTQNTETALNTPAGPVAQPTEVGATPVAHPPLNARQRTPGKPNCPLCRGMGVSGPMNREGVQKSCKCIRITRTQLKAMIEDAIAKQQKTVTIGPDTTPTVDGAPHALPS